MPRSPKNLLEDIRDAILAIQRFTADITLEDYRINDLVQSAVERQFIIIGEATSQLAVADPVRAGNIRDKRDIISFRNLIAHHYWRLDEQLVWKTIEQYLDPLRSHIEQLLAELE